MDIQKILNAYRNPVLIFGLDEYEIATLAELFEMVQKICYNLSRSNETIFWDRTEDWVFEIFASFGFVVEYYMEDDTCVGIKISAF